MKSCRLPELNIGKMATLVHLVFIHHTEEPHACIAAVKGIQNFHNDTRDWFETKLMLDLALKWIERGIEKGIIAKDYQLNGHRDQNCTSCPGQYLNDIIIHWNNFKAGKSATYVCSR
jgi:hypothetical protein